MRLFKRILISLILISILMSIGCSSSGPTTENIKPAIEKALKQEVPKGLVKGETVALARKAVTVDKVEIIKIGQSDKIKIMDFTVTYWPVKVKVEGTCKDRFDINEGIFDFEGEMDIFVFKDPNNGEWNLWKDKSVINMYK